MLKITILLVIGFVISLKINRVTTLPWKGFIVSKVLRIAVSAKYHVILRWVKIKKFKRSYDTYL